jgi:NAD+ kinase
VKRTVLLVAHVGRPAALRIARLVVERLAAAGVGVRVLEPEAAELRLAGAEIAPATPTAAHDTEMVIALGGDGTLLRAAEMARPAGAPLLGVNLGHVGFLAEAEPDDLADAVDRVVEHQYSVEERMTIEVTVRRNGGVTHTTWALNEASVEKVARERMIEVVTEIDGRPLSNWACDGVVCATPTGSTAYAFSAGGPIVWPDVEALLLVPISAHALFNGPVVVSPRSVLAVELLGVSGADSRPPVSSHNETRAGVLWCDGRRSIDLAPGARVEVRRGAQPVLLARLSGGTGGQAGGALFTDRLVVKFGLPVTGWRGRRGRGTALAGSGRGQRPPGARLDGKEEPPADA